MTIARFPTFVLDCPDAVGLARFYAEVLGWEAELQEGWVDIRPADRSNVISFQQVDGYVAPDWPGQDRPQQMHIDVVVDDLDTAEQAVVALGARTHEHQPGTSFRVMLDPAGHPFCLCLN